MIQQQTVLNVSDNSGAKQVKCIKVLGGFKRKFAVLGDIIVVTIYKIRSKSRQTAKVKKGEIFKALIIKTKKKCSRKDGSSLNFDDNSVILLNNNYSPVSNRILGNIPRTLKKTKLAKFGSMSLGVVWKISEWVF